MDSHYAIFNPQNKPIDELPVIYGFNNGGSNEFYYAQLIAEDGTRLGSHICSSEQFMYGDLGILEGFRPDRHEAFKKHYPNGYRMDFISLNDVKNHVALQKAFKLNEKLADDKKNKGGQASVVIEVGN
jgi:hypothetical protein